MDKAEARRQLGLIVNCYTADPSAPDVPYAPVRKADGGPADDDALPPVPLERELIAFSRAKFRHDPIPFFFRLDFEFGPSFDRKKFDEEFRATWLNGTEEIGILQWVPFSCTLTQHDWSEGSVLSTLWNRWVQERVMNFGLINQEIQNEVRERLAAAGHELAADDAAFQPEVTRVRQLYPVLERNKK